MKLSKRLLLAGFLAAAAIWVIDSQGSLAAQDKQQDTKQDKQQDKKKGGKQGAPSFKGEKFAAAFRDSLTAAAKSTVRIKCDGKDTALGVVLTADGFILTKASDLTGKVTVLLRSGEELEAAWVGHHDPHDLAVLKITATNLVPVEFTDSKAAPVGNFVASPGMGSDPVAVGVVSVAARTVPPPKAPKEGGKGEGKGGGGKGFGPANPLGVITADDPKGAKVTGFAKGGGGGKGGKGGGGPPPAAEKFKVDDIIIAIGDKSIANTETLNKVLQSYKAGQEVTLKLLRGDESLEFKMPLPKQQGKADQNSMGSELSKRRTGFLEILQHDSVVKPNDCGGPLVDLEGHVIGINIARWGRVESYAVPSETIRPLLKDLMSGKLPPQKKK